MGLSDAIIGAVGSAFTALSDLATQMTYRSVAPGVYVPDPGVNFDPVTEYSITGFVLNYKDTELDGDRVRKGDRKIIIQQADLSVTPALQDQIETASGAIYSVIGIEQDPVGAVWTLQGRWNA